MAAPGLPARLSMRLAAHLGYRSARPAGAIPRRAGYARRDAPRRRRQAGLLDARGRPETAAPGTSRAPRFRARRSAADRHARLRRLEWRDRARPRGARARRAARATCRTCRPPPPWGRGCSPAPGSERSPRRAGAPPRCCLTADDVRRRTSYLNARATLEALLSWDVVPIVNENDSTATDEITFGDNDALAAQVALLLRARLLVLLTDAEGLYTRDPRAAGRRARARGARPRAARRSRSRCGLGQRARIGWHALEGRCGLDGGGRRRRLRDRLGRAARAPSPARSPAAPWARASPRRAGPSRPGSCGCATASRRPAACSSTRAHARRSSRAARASCR